MTFSLRDVENNFCRFKLCSVLAYISGCQLEANLKDLNMENLFIKMNKKLCNFLNIYFFLVMAEFSIFVESITNRFAIVLVF